MPVAHANYLILKCDFEMFLSISQSCFNNSLKHAGQLINCCDLMVNNYVLQNRKVSSSYRIGSHQ